MRYRSLGRTGIQVSEIAFGCVEIGIPYGIGVTTQADMLAEQDAVDLLRQARDRGISFFDTAPAYGRSESLLGRAFADCRDRVVLCTKCGRLTDEDGRLKRGRALADAVERSLEGSLRALGTGYVDVLLLHQVSAEVLASDEVVAALTACRRRGLARAIGVSTYSEPQTGTVLEAGVWDVVQLALNLMDQRQAALLPLAAQRGVGVMVRSALLKGILSDRGAHLHPALHRVEMHRQTYQRVLDAHGLTLAALATKFALSFAEVSAVLLGIDRAAYLEQALAAAGGNPLPPGTVAELRASAYPDPDFLDLPAWDRKGWLR